MTSRIMHRIDSILVTNYKKNVTVEWSDPILTDVTRCACVDMREVSWVECLFFVAMHGIVFKRFNQCQCVMVVTRQYFHCLGLGLGLALTVLVLRHLIFTQLLMNYGADNFHWIDCPKGECAMTDFWIFLILFAIYARSLSGIWKTDASDNFAAKKR